MSGKRFKQIRKYAQQNREFPDLLKKQYKMLPPEGKKKLVEHMNKYVK